MNIRFWASRFALMALSSFIAFSGRPLLGQAAAPNAGLDLLGVIPIPNWTTSGQTQANYDLFSFNPYTRIMYVADRVNHGATAIDTRTNAVLGTVSPPGCDTGTQCPSGVLVVPDLQKLVLTDRRTSVFIYDLVLPGPPVTITVPNGADELDYDPLHHRIYVANTSAPFFLTGIDLAGAAANTVVGQIPLPGSPEQPRFNPVNGLIYQNIAEDKPGVAVIDPTQGDAGEIVQLFPVPDCGPTGIDIDPVTNRAVVGCGGSNSLVSIELNDGAIRARFPQVTGADVGYFNPNLRRWYMAAGNNRGGVDCPQDTTGSFPVVGVFAAAARFFEGPGLVGVQCAGRNSHGLGVDPFENNIYVGARQFPADPKSPDTGQAGVLAFHDPATLTQETPRRSSAVLSARNDNGASGIVRFELQGRTMRVEGRAQDLPDATPVLLNVTTTIGNEVVSCTNDGGTAACRGTLLGDPLIGGVVLLAAGGTPAAQGRIVRERSEAPRM
jgi:DNA-binding beta-propeller fold protein YncE